MDRGRLGKVVEVGVESLMQAGLYRYRVSVPGASTSDVDRFLVEDEPGVYGAVETMGGVPTCTVYRVKEDGLYSEPTRQILPDGSMAPYDPREDDPDELVDLTLVVPRVAPADTPLSKVMKTVRGRRIACTLTVSRRRWRGQACVVVRTRNEYGGDVEAWWQEGVGMVRCLVRSLAAPGPGEIRLLDYEPFAAEISFPLMPPARA